MFLALIGGKKKLTYIIPQNFSEMITKFIFIKKNVISGNFFQSIPQKSINNFFKIVLYTPITFLFNI
jgi:hypothetical protein